MPLSGVIPVLHGAGLRPSTSWFLRGTDGGHYTVTGVVGAFYGTDQIQVGCAETQTQILSLTNSQVKSDFNGAGLGGGVTAIDFMAEGPFPIPGTNKFIVGCAGGGVDGFNYVLGVRYAIASPSSITVDGVFAYKNDEVTYTGIGVTAWCKGTGVVDGELYALAWCWQGGVSKPSGGYLVRLPIVGNVLSSILGGWNARVINLSSIFGNTLQYFAEPWITNGAAILKYPGTGNVMVLTYRTHNTVPGALSGLTSAGSEYVICNSSGAFGSLQNGQVSLGLGQPWPDVGLGYSGSPSVNPTYDDYSAPTVKDTAIAGIKEVLFSRPFYDQPTKNRIRRFSYDESTGLFTAIDVTDFEMSGITESQFDRGVISLRDTSASVLSARYDNGHWKFGEVALPDSPVTADCAPDFADDLLPIDVTWPECDLVPEAITVEMVCPTNSPGRSLTSFEQVIQADPGCWRITLHGIKVWSQADVLLWREIESKLNGRVGVATVPFYEAKHTPAMVAVAHADYPIGAVKIGIEQMAGAAILAGQHFSTPTFRGYRIKRVHGTVAGTTTVTIWPPLREPINVDDALDFNTPKIRCQLESDDGMDIVLGRLKFAKPSVTFIEQV